MSFELVKDTISQFKFNKINKYTFWIYFIEYDIPVVYENYMPNTEQIFFEFRQINLFYWKMMENFCCEEIKNNVFFNNYKLKKFLINYMLVNTNIPGSFIQRDGTGKLTKESYESVISIHPYILRTLFNVIRIFPDQLSKKEEKMLTKQCSTLFGRGQGVTNPHPWITEYCNLTSFWDRFGMNYHDIMNLPYEKFMTLNKIMHMDNDFKNQKISQSHNKNNQHPTSRKKGVRF